MSVAGVNSIGRGPFSDPVEVQIGTGKYTLSVLVNNSCTLYSVPGPVSTLSSLMSTTWAVISWSVPSYIPVDYPIITYEIGYTTHQSNDSCSPSDEFNLLYFPKIVMCTHIEVKVRRQIKVFFT